MESMKNRTNRVNIWLHEQSYEKVSSFKYLDSVVSYNSDVTDDIKQQLNQLSHTYHSKVRTITDRTASVPMTWKRKILSHV